MLGMMAKMPVGGVIWQTLHYLLGFRRLGFEVYYVEAHAVAPSMFLNSDDVDGSVKAAAFIDGVLRRVDLGTRWAFIALHSDGRCYGKSELELSNLYGSAELIINLHGGTVPTPECNTRRLVYIETDPVVTQIELARERGDVRFLGRHFAFFTFGENYRPARLPPAGRRAIPLQADPPAGGDGPLGRVRRRARRYLHHGGELEPAAAPVFSFEGETYTWSKHHKSRGCSTSPRGWTSGWSWPWASAEDERRMLRDRGWSVRDALEVSREPDDYRRYVSGSRGEFTVAKDQNVRFRTGWFSDRGASYLAAGRPVVTQETGFSDRLPTGDGLFAFSTPDEAVSAIEAINVDYPRHRRAAREIADEFFDSDSVLTRLLDDL